MNRFLTIVVLGFTFSSLFSQVGMIPFEDYLKSQSIDENGKERDPRNLYSIYFNSPRFDEVEFRTETDEFDLSQMEYTLRFSPNNKEVRKYQNRIYQDLKQEYLNELIINQEDFFEEKYVLYLDYYFSLQKQNLRKQILPIYEDMVTVLTKENRDGTVNVTDLIDVSRKKEKLEARISAVESELNISNLTASDQQSIIQPDDMNQVLAPLWLMDGQVADAQALGFQLSKIENEYRLEKAEKDKRLDFAQIRYKGRDNSEWEEKVSLGFGFRFPHSGRSDLDMIELKLEKMIEEEKYNRRKQEFFQDKSNVMEEFNTALKNYNNALTIVEKLKKYEQITKDFKPSTKSEVIDILELNIDSIEEDMNLLDAKEELYNSYIDALKTMGAFSTLEIKNYLSPGLEPIK